MKKYYIATNKYTVRERITQKGRVFDIVFRIQLASDGSIKQKSLCGFENKTKAKAAYLDFIQKNCLTSERPVFPKKIEPTKKEPTVAELVPQYIKSLQNQNKQSSVYDKKHIFDLWIIPMLGSVKLKDLTKERLIQWQDDLWQKRNPKTKEFYSYKYLSKIRTHFSAMLSYAQERYGYKNYLLEVRKPRKIDQSNRSINFWTKEEFNQFLSAIPQQKYRTFFAMLFYTGRRKSEIVALHPDDIKDNKIIVNKTYSRKNLDGNSYIITSTKTTRCGESYICSDLRVELDKYEGGFPFYFGGKDPISENAITNAFKRGIKLSGVQKIRIHDLRHSFVSRLIHLGASPYVIASSIGDNVDQVFKTYGHMYEEDKKSIFNLL